MSMLGKMLGKEIAEGEADLEALDAKITAAEKKVVPFLQAVAPEAEAVVKELVALSPTLARLVTPTMTADFAEGIAALPRLLPEMHTLITEAENKLKNI